MDAQPGTAGQHVATGEDAACCTFVLLAVSIRGRDRLGQVFERMEVGWQCWSAQELVAIRTQDATSAAVSGEMSRVHRHTCALKEDTSEGGGGRTVRIPGALGTRMPRTLFYEEWRIDVLGAELP